MVARRQIQSENPEASCVSTTTPDHNYDEKKIKTLSSLEHIRKRTGMYIGRIGNGQSYDDGIYILLKEVVDNCIDEFVMGHGKKIDITMEDGVVEVRDYGRGMDRELS
jgi:topoisomerase-4 subunit B